MYIAECCISLKNPGRLDLSLLFNVPWFFYIVEIIRLFFSFNLTFGIVFRKFFSHYWDFSTKYSWPEAHYSIVYDGICFVCICVYVGMYVPQCMCGGQRISLRSRISPPTLFWGGISLVISAITQCSRLTGPGTSRWFSYLCFLSCCRSSGITDVCHTIQIFMCGLGIKLRPAGLCNKHVTCQAIVPAHRMVIFLIKLKIA